MNVFIKLLTDTSVKDSKNGLQHMYELVRDFAKNMDKIWDWFFSKLNVKIYNVFRWLPGAPDFFEIKLDISPATLLTASIGILLGWLFIKNLIK